MTKDGPAQRRSGSKDVPASKTTTGAAKATSLAKNAKKAALVIQTSLELDPLRKQTGPSRRADKKREPPPKLEDPLTDDFQVIFGENLKAVRLRSGLKQSDVAEQAGLTQQRLSQIENGHQNLTLRTMVRLAAAWSTTSAAC